jgi:hypothetical protein
MRGRPIRSKAQDTQLYLTPHRERCLAVSRSESPSSALAYTTLEIAFTCYPEVATPAGISANAVQFEAHGRAIVKAISEQ